MQKKIYCFECDTEFILKYEDSALVVKCCPFCKKECDDKDTDVLGDD